MGQEHVGRNADIWKGLVGHSGDKQDDIAGLLPSDRLYFRKGVEMQIFNLKNKNWSILIVVVCYKYNDTAELCKYNISIMPLISFF